MRTAAVTTLLLIRYYGRYDVKRVCTTKRRKTGFYDRHEDVRFPLTRPPVFFFFFFFSTTRCIRSVYGTRFIAAVFRCRRVSKWAGVAAKRCQVGRRDVRGETLLREESVWNKSVRTEAFETEKNLNRLRSTEVKGLMKNPRETRSNNTNDTVIENRIKNTIGRIDVGELDENARVNKITKKSIRVNVNVLCNIGVTGTITLFSTLYYI